MADHISFYLKIDSIKGESTEKDHKEWIPILAFAVTELPHVTGKGKVDYTRHRVNFVAPLDKSFQQIMRSASASDSFDLATLDQVKDSTIKPTFLRLGNVTVMDCRTTQDGFSFTLEVMSIEYGPAYVPQDQFRYYPADFAQRDPASRIR